MLTYSLTTDDNSFQSLDQVRGLEPGVRLTPSLDGKTSGADVTFGGEKATLTCNINPGNDHPGRSNVIRVLLLFKLNGQPCVIAQYPTK